MNRNRRDEFPDAHGRARGLILASRVEGISDGEREWLDAHLQQCPRCAEEASAVAALIEALRAAPALASDEMVERTRLAVRRRSAELGVEEARTVPLTIAVAFSAASMVLTVPYLWWAYASLGRTVGVPDVVWQIGFVVWWFLPATAAAAILAARHAGNSSRNSHWMRQTSWGES